MNKPKPKKPGRPKTGQPLKTPMTIYLTLDQRMQLGMIGRRLQVTTSEAHRQALEIGIEKLLKVPTDMELAIQRAQKKG